MITYTAVDKDGAAKSYECDLCGASSPNLDAARAHHTVHVAGPGLLASLKEVVAISDRKHDAWDKAHAEIEKAEPKGA